MRIGRIMCLAMAVWCALCGASSAQMLNEQASIRMGRIVVPTGGAAVQIGPDGTILLGSQYVLPSPPYRAGQYRVTGAAGSIDISVSNVISCDPSVTLSFFRGDWGGVIRGDISTAGYVGAAFDGDEILYLGVRATYTDAVPIGNCSPSFDLNILTY